MSDESFSLDESTSEESLRILIVDDDEVDRISVRRALSKSGLSLIFAEAGTCKEAIELLSNDQFDCTFLDYGLPDQNGLFLVQAASRLKIQHPIVILTGQGDEQIAVELMKAGATDYLAKSHISPTTLSQILRNSMRIYRAEQDVLEAGHQLKLNNALLLQQNQDLEEQRVQIETQNLQRADFIAHLTHDLRTPLVAANLMFKLFEQEAFCPLSTEMHEAVAAMNRSNQNLLDLVNTLLEVHCYESGTKALTMSTCDMWDIVQEVVQELQPLARYKSIKLTMSKSVSNPKSLKVLGDCLEIRRMVSNLLGNSLKFTDAGQVEVRLSFREGNEAKPSALDGSALNGWVFIEIQDTGVGMSLEEQKNIFQRFHTGKHRQSGSGLGLHLVERIVTIHSGTITVMSELGKGSLFQIRLPAHQV